MGGLDKQTAFVIPYAMIYDTVEKVDAAMREILSGGTVYDLAQMKLDAARYRWLRDAWIAFYDKESHETVDAAIDSAMQASRREE